MDGGPTRRVALHLSHLAPGCSVSGGFRGVSTARITYHDATVCSFDGSEVWVSVLRLGGRIADTAEHDTRDEAIAHCGWWKQQRALACKIEETTTR